MQTDIRRKGLTIWGTQILRVGVKNPLNISSNEQLQSYEKIVFQEKPNKIINVNLCHQELIIEIEIVIIKTD